MEQQHFIKPVKLHVCVYIIMMGFFNFQSLTEFWPLAMYKNI